MTAFIIAITPFILNGLMFIFKLLVNVQDTAGKRILLGILSLIGVLAGNALSGSPIDTVTIGGLVQTILLALVAFLAAHGSYNIFGASSTTGAAVTGPQ